MTTLFRTNQNKVYIYATLNKMIYPMITSTQSNFIRIVRLAWSFMKGADVRKFCYSRTADDVGIRNTIEDWDTTRNVLFSAKLFRYLQTCMRDLGVSLTLTSGYRCERLNCIVGGNPSSKHLVGLAFDFVAVGEEKYLTIANFISYLPDELKPYVTIIDEKTHYHLQIDSNIVYDEKVTVLF